MVAKSLWTRMRFVHFKSSAMIDCVSYRALHVLTGDKRYKGLLHIRLLFFPSLAQTEYDFQMV